MIKIDESFIDKMEPGNASFAIAPSDFHDWPRIWSVSGVSNLVGTSFTEDRER
jgi:hypothetical protein